MLQFASVPIPITAIAGVPLDFMKHRMNPRGGVVGLILLRDAVGGIPLSGECQLYGLDKFFVHDEGTG